MLKKRDFLLNCIVWIKNKGSFFWNIHSHKKMGKLLRLNKLVNNSRTLFSQH